MIAVKIENVKKSYKDTKALKGVSAEIKSGELYGLLGLNGAGKTTLISVIAGLIKADEGDIAVDGKSVKTDSDEVKRIIAVSPQETAVAPNLTVKENLDTKIYSTMIPRNIRLAEAPSYGIPINMYDSKSAGAESYRSLAKEIIDRKDL